jgi:hypothetical protein
VPIRFAATWNSGDGLKEIIISAAEELRGRLHSHFGHGILTFDVGYVFRTEPNVNLWVTGAVNRPKDGISPLSGLIEAEWISLQLHHELAIHPAGGGAFRRDEPFCFFFPVGRGGVDACEPELRGLYDDAELAALYTSWRERRAGFPADLAVPGSEAQEAKWQRSYFRGLRPDGGEGVANHQTRVRPKPFAPPRSGGA